MSTNYYSTKPQSLEEAMKIAESAGWREKIVNNMRMLTDGDNFVSSIEMVLNDDETFCATFERFGDNDCESLVTALEAWSEHDNALLNCDNCGRYMWEDDMYTRNDSVICPKCFNE